MAVVRHLPLGYSALLAVRDTGFKPLLRQRQVAPVRRISRLGLQQCAAVVEIAQVCGHAQRTPEAAPNSSNTVSVPGTHLCNKCQ